MDSYFCAPFWLNQMLWKVKGDMKGMYHWVRLSGLQVSLESIQTWRLYGSMMCVWCVFCICTHACTFRDHRVWEMRWLAVRCCFEECWMKLYLHIYRALSSSVELSREFWSLFFKKIGLTYIPLWKGNIQEELVYIAATETDKEKY